jgi:hypothetical protein
LCGSPPGGTSGLELRYRPFAVLSRHEEGVSQATLITTLGTDVILLRQCPSLKKNVIDMTIVSSGMWRSLFC